MGDGIYQSAVCFFMAYLLFQPGHFNSENGRDLGERSRMGVYVACVAIAVINSYILLNTYRWDWLMLLITSISILLVFAWTGIYSSFTGSTTFYKAGSEVFGSLSFWTVSLLTLTICLLPRFSIKYFQKKFKPYDVDIVREQVRRGDFEYLNEYEAFVPPKAIVTSASSSEATEEFQPEANAGQTPHHARGASMTESQRPIYPPSEAPTQGTRHPHSQTGSDGTDRSRPSFDWTKPPRRPSLERINSSPGESHKGPQRPSLDRVRSSFERSRQSFDRMRPSFEGSRDFTSAALLARVESSQSVPTSGNLSPGNLSPNALTPVPTRSRRYDDITSTLQ